MNKKKGVMLLSLILAFAILTVSFATAANESTSTANLTGFEKSYSCLKNSIDAKTNKYKDLTLEELTFSLMALGYDSTRQSDITAEIESRKDASNCWPKDACAIKDTSQVLLAYDHIKKDTDSIQNWLLNQTSYSSDLVWYLQVDTNNKSQCKITYDNSTKVMTINEDKTLSGNLGACLTLAYGGYWLEMSNNCIGKQFEISCDQDFITSTFYRRSSGSTYYVSDLTNVGAANGKTQEKVESLCFKQAGLCNYEGSLWASIALQKTLTDKSRLKKFLPDLITLYEDSNSKRFFPSTFLYSITGYDEYFSEISNLQNTQGFWQITDTSKRYYDTAIALLSLYGKSTSQAEKAISYLLTPNVQGDGCWNSIRDTAFILYSASPKPASGGGSITVRSQCEDFPGQSCTAYDTCINVLKGDDISKNFQCSGLGICCNKKEILPTCADKGGKQCLSNEECSSGVVNSLDSSQCCTGECNAIVIPPQETIPCTDSGYLCKISCSSNEEATSLSCGEGTVGESCCMPKAGGSSLWIWVLVLLIILVILGIVFRDKLKLWLFQLQSKFNKQPVQPQQRPAMPPQGMSPQQPAMMRRPVGPPFGQGGIPQRQVPVSPRPFPKDNELDATLRKLKGM